MFRILQGELRKAWSDQLAAGVIAVCPIVELEFLYSARSLADRLEKQRLIRDLFGWVPLPEDLLVAATAERERLIVLSDDRDFQTGASVTGPRQRCGHVLI